MRVVIALIWENGKYLAVSRKTNHKIFGFPGGKIDGNETPEEAIVREVKEETGYDVESIKLMDKRVYNGYDKFAFIVTVKGEKLSNEELISRNEGICQWVDQTVLYNKETGVDHNYNKKIVQIHQTYYENR